jgi:uncharacterized protein (TIGR03437 family)
MPGLFYLGYTSNQGAILNQDGSLNSPNNPARAGDVISLFGTGGGLASAPEVTGRYWGTSTNTLLALPVTARIGNISALVLYAGAAPTLLSSLFQIDVQTPPSLVPSGSTGAVISVGVGGVSSIQSVTIAVH